MEVTAEWMIRMEPPSELFYRITTTTSGSRVGEKKKGTIFWFVFPALFILFLY